ncbi:MAG: hypothetical protein ABEJ88_01535 [Halobacterium sp.]
MGIIEFHFHEPSFDFAPSIGKETGGEDAGESESDHESTLEVGDGEQYESGASGVGALVALAVLVVLAAAVGLKRRRGGSEEPAEEAEIEVAE